MKKYLIILLTLGIILTRFIGLSKIPPALNRDEAAIGWNAYSILNTSKDEHNEFLPMNFISIGDYKMPFYIYASVLPVKLFGLNEFSIRFWSSLAGGASILAIFLLTKKLFSSKKVALFSSILMLFNPWAVFYSRVAFEANLALSFFLLGTLLIINNRLFIGLILYLLSSLTYSSSLILVPFFCLALVIYNKKLIKKQNWLAWGGFIALYILLFIGIWTTSSHKSTISVFSNPTIIDSYNHLRTKIYLQTPLLAKLWYNRPLYLLRITLKNYFKTFSFSFLITKGGNHPWHQITNLGNFYLFEIFFALFGLFKLVKSKLKPGIKWLVISWLLISPIASAITIDAPHTTRSLYLLPVIIMLSAYGLAKFISTYRHKSTPILLIVCYLAFVAYGAYQYLIIYPKNFPKSIHNGLKQALEFVKEKQASGTIYLTDIHSSTYLYPAIYLDIKPEVFQNTALWTQPDTLGLTDVYQFKNIKIVDDLKDIIDPDVVILPINESYDSPLNIHYKNNQYKVLLK